MHEFPRLKVTIKFALLILSSCFLAGYPIAASEASDIVLTDTADSYVIGDRVFVLYDTTAELSFEKVLQKDGGFVPSKASVPSWGITKSAVWLKIVIKNNSTRPVWYLELGNPYIYELEFYQPDTAGNFRCVQLGTNTSFQNRPVRVNQVIIPLNVPAGGTKIYYCRLKSRLFLRAQLRVASMQKLYESNHDQDMFNGLYFGLLIALITYNLFVFISLRDKTYLYYVLYSFFLGLHVAVLKGYGLEYLWPDKVWMNSTNIIICGSITFAVFFTNSFLHTRHYVPALYKYQWIIFAIVIISLVLTFIGYTMEGFVLLAFNPAYVYYVFIMGIGVYRKGFKPAKYYILGFGILVLEIVVFELYEYGFLPHSTLTSHSLEIGSAIEAIVLSFALANKLQFYKKETEDAQTLALQQATEFSQQLIQSQENERKRIAAELHDSVGQSLIVIKNKVHLLKNQNAEKKTMDINDLPSMITDAIQEVRSISYGLRPFQLDLLGLTKSIHELIDETSESSGIRFKTVIDNIDGIFANENEINIYRIIQESVNNIVKHSNAAEAAIFIRRKESSVEISIEDYGKGFVGNSAKDHKHGFGLIGVKERLNILGGKILYEKAVPQGTSVNIFLPINHAWKYYTSN